MHPNKENLRIHPLAILQGHSSEVAELKFSPDGQFLACAGNEGNVYIWDIQNSQQVQCFAAHPGLWTEQAEAVYGFAWSPRGDILATGGGSHFLHTMAPDAGIKLWKVEFLA